jgi:exodeoxyribonuclease VII large subunit
MWGAGVLAVRDCTGIGTLRQTSRPKWTLTRYTIIVSFFVRSPASSRGPGAPERDVYSVSRLNREVRLLLESGMPVIWIAAELSNFAAPSSGHWYFSLKDATAQVRCAMWKQRNAAVGFRPKDGLQVLARARVGLYEPRGDYQLIVEHLEEAGLGALKREFEKLKAKLAAEGLFAEDRKRALPTVPQRVGVVTSPTGAAIRDILHVLARRFPAAPVVIYPTAVQGAAAAPEIIAAIHAAEARAECDVLIVARGGGSLEDLWCFNDERVVRAIAACSIPVVSGVGHEVDFTLTDFAADVRAPTPSAAAQVVVPDKREWLNLLAAIEQRLTLTLRRNLRELAERFANLQRRMRISHPGARLAQSAQRLDDLEQRLLASWRAARQDALIRLNDASRRLAVVSPAAQVAAYHAKTAALSMRLANAVRQRLTRVEQRLQLAARALDAVSPLATLDRGFAIVTDAEAHVVTDAAKVRPGDSITVRVARGRLDATATKIHPPESKQ